MPQFRKLGVVVGAASSGVCFIWTISRWLVGTGGSIDLIVSRSQDPGWIGIVIAWIIDTPIWVQMLVGLVGCALNGVLIWDGRRPSRASLRQAFTSGLIERPERIEHSASFIRLKGLLEPSRSGLSPADRLKVGQVEFLAFYQRATSENDYEAYLISGRIADWLIAAARSYYASSSPYHEIVSTVNEQLEALHRHFSRFI